MFTSADAHQSLSQHPFTQRLINHTAYNGLSMSLSFHSDQWNMEHTETGKYMSFKQVIRVYFNGMASCHSFYYNDNFL